MLSSVFCCIQQVQVRMAVTLNKISKMFNGFWGRKSLPSVVDRQMGAYRGGPDPNRENRQCGEHLSAIHILPSLYNLKVSQM